MNFCGGELEQVHDASKELPESTFCGPCVKDEESPLDAVFSEEDENQAQFSVEQTLDVIQETLESGDLSPASTQSMHVVVVGVDAKPIPITTMMPSPISAARISNPTSPIPEDAVVVPGIDASQLASLASPLSPGGSRLRSRLATTSSTSPTTFLDPSSDDWVEAARRAGAASGSAHPALGRLNSIDGLLKRLEKGFRVQLHHRTSLSAIEEVLLYLTPDRSGICLQTDEDEKKEDQVKRSYWHQIAVADILRLEIGGKTRCLAHPMTSFAVVVSHNNDVVYYDFEADSPIEREIIVSTLMVVLEQAQAHTGDSFSLELNLGGTMDQPIPCSPSLEVDFLPHGHTVDESHEVIHLEDVTSPEESFETASPRQGSSHDAALHPTMRGARGSKRPGASRELVTRASRELVGGKDAIRSSVGRTTEDLMEFDGSGQIASAWCADDICTLALKDIADTCSGIFALKQGDGGCTISGLPDEQRQMVEEYITSALGTPSAVYAYISEIDVWSAENPPEPAIRPEVPLPGGHVINRASILNAQANRLRQLRNEMTFAAALKHSKDQTHYIQTTQSFDDAKAYGNRELKAVSDRFHSSALLRTLVGNMTVSRTGSEDEVAFYDSDPEDTRTQSMYKKGPRKVAAERLHKEKKFTEGRRAALSGGGFDKVGSSKRLSKKLDEDVITQLVQTMLNERLTLMWHPTQDKREPNKSPSCVKMWVEAGVSLVDGTFLLPKLSWAKAFELDHEDPSNAARRRVFRTEPVKVDLLDICRIRATDNIDRRRHPFATPRKSFLVETQSDFFLFEAQSTEECDRIVYGLKLVVARLASLLMLRDVRAAEEFFGAAVASSVPGEAPEWAQGGGPPHKQIEPEPTLPTL